MFYVGGLLKSKIVSFRSFFLKTDSKSLDRNECNVILHLRAQLESLLNPLQRSKLEQVHIRPRNVNNHLDIFISVLCSDVGVIYSSCRR